MLTRRHAVAQLGLTLGAAAVPQLAPAQTDFPSRPVTIIMPVSPGGSSDTIARVMAQKLSQIWGQPVVVDNRPGAAGVIGTELAARAKPDGHTLLAGFSEHAWMQYFPQKIPFDMTKAFVPVMLVGDVPNVVAVSPSLKAGTLQELIALLKSQPGKFNFGGGVGTTLHLYGELFKKQAGVDLVNVPYRGGNEALLALMGGQVEMVFPTSITVQPHVATGKVRVLAVSAPKRLAMFPDIPTVAEAGMPDLKISIWHCVFAPAGTPKEIVAKINADMVKAGNSPEVRERLSGIGVDLVLSSPDAFASFFEEQRRRWGEIIETAKIDFK